MVEMKEHNHKQVVSETIKNMANTDKIIEILKTFPDEKRKEYINQMKNYIVPSWYVNNCQDCSQEFSNTLTEWENGNFGDDNK